MKEIAIFILVISLLLIGCNDKQVQEFKDQYGDEIKAEVKGVVKEAIDESQIKDDTIVCNPPYIRFADSCCLDSNSNLICDEHEEKPEEIKEEQEETEIEETIESEGPEYICDPGYGVIYEGNNEPIIIIFNEILDEFIDLAKKEDRTLLNLDKNCMENACEFLSDYESSEIFLKDAGSARVGTELRRTCGISVLTTLSRSSRN